MASKNGYIVLQIFGDHSDLQKLGRGIGPIHKNVRLAAVAKGFEHVGDGQKIAFIIDEEGVSEECVVVAAGGRRLIVGVNDRTDGSDGGVVSVWRNDLSGFLASR